MAPSLARRFVLTVLFGAIVPLALVGLWTTRTAARSGRALLESQLLTQLGHTARDIETRWSQHRGDLLMLGESEPARLALLDSMAPAAAPEFVRTSFSRLTAFSRVVIHDRLGRERWTLAAPELPGAPSSAEERSREIAVSIPLTDLLSGDTIGRIDASLRVVALLDPAAMVGAASGPLTGVFEGQRALAVPPGVDDRLFVSERVEWSGHRWLTVRTPIDGLPVDLRMAGALTPYVEPFERSASRGAFALLAAAMLVVGVVATLTRRMTREVERTLAQREALAAVGEFAGELAHEVRNPLTAMRLDLQRVEEAANDAHTVRTVVPRVLAQIDRLERAVSGALRVTRSGSMEPRPVVLREILEAACRSATPEFARRGAVLEAVLPDAATVLDGDAVALEQLFLNLLINAAQALPREGRADLRTSRANGTIEVVITDNGAGMTERQLAAIQQPYQSSRRDGTGLGLKIARRIATSHGGQIALSSRAGQGTTARVVLPVR